MMLAGRIDTDNGTYWTTEQWNEIFAAGYLEPQNHSYYHDRIYADTEDYSEENVYQEIEQSRDELAEKFPDYDILSFAIPSSLYRAEPYAKLMATHYAARGGVCSYENTDPVADHYTTQSYNPARAKAVGAMYNLRCARLSARSSSDKVNMTKIYAYIEDCIEDRGWFVGLCHGIGTDEDAAKDKSVHWDITPEDCEALLATIRGYVDEGKIWCASFSDAVKYLRERQNTTVREYATSAGLFVELTMAETTDDGLALDPEVFNHPLTVKATVPAEWSAVRYTQDGVTHTAPTFTEDGVTFAYLDLDPTAGAASLEAGFGASDYVSALDIRQSITVDGSIGLNLYIPTDSDISAVSIDGVEAVGEVIGEHNVYTVKNIYIDDIATSHSVTLSFTKASGYGKYSFSFSPLTYLQALMNSEGVGNMPEAERRLIYDFAIYAREACAYLGNTRTRDALAALDLTALGLAERTGLPTDPDELGNLAEALSGAAFTLNEKPYYMIYLKPGFTGTLTVAEGDDIATYEVVNGYYRCRQYVIFEPDGIYALIDGVDVTAIGEIDGAAVNATGSYSITSYVAGVKNGTPPAYALSLYNYCLSADAFRKEG